MKNILLITTFYPNPLRPGTPVCHFFAREWKKMGYNVLVLHYRSMFPAIYIWAAKLLPGLAQKYVGNHVEMDTNMNTLQYEEEGIPVYSIPIFKYISHGRYSSKTINKEVNNINSILKERNFVPDAIIGHFYNPSLPLVSALKTFYPNAKTCISFHETDPGNAVKSLAKDYHTLLSNVDVIGFRSYSLKRAWESVMGEGYKYAMCLSGTSKEFIEKPLARTTEFGDGKLTKFIYVGQLIKRKYPDVVISALSALYPKKDFELKYVGSKEYFYEDVRNLVDELGCSRQTLFLGQLKREDIIKEYDAAECFIMISAKEIFGLVYLEAMARGCIVVAAKNEGMDGIIVHGENGFLCEAGNEQELVEIIKQINKLSKKEKERIAENGRKTANELSDFNVAKIYIDSVINN